MSELRVYSVSYVKDLEARVAELEGGIEFLMGLAIPGNDNWREELLRMSDE